jgi:hypothetical protein
MKIAQAGLPAENRFLDRTIRYLISSGGPGRKGSSSGHILRAEYSMGSGFNRALPTHLRSAPNPVFLLTGRLKAG